MAAKQRRAEVRVIFIDSRLLEFFFFCLERDEALGNGEKSLLRVDVVVVCFGCRIKRRKEKRARDG